MFGNFGIWELLIVLLIVGLVFGTTKLKNMGGDLGSALRSFKSGLNGEANPDQDKENDKS